MPALTFPLALSEFQDRFRIETTSFHLPSANQTDRTAGGAILKSSLGDQLWRGSIKIPQTTDRSESAQLDALVSLLDRSGSFLAYHAAKTHPAKDPDGSILGAATPSILSLDAGDARMVALEGLPAGYELTGGDLIGWQYGGSPVFYAMHRLISDVTANGSGQTALFEVHPFINPGVALSTPVTLIKPVIKAVMEPNPTYAEDRAVVSSGQQFSFVQTNR